MTGEDKEPSRRKVRIERRDILRYGMTEGCRGCVQTEGQIMTGRNEECRRRIEAEIAKDGDARIGNYEKRLEEEFRKIKGGSTVVQVSGDSVAHTPLLGMHSRGSSGDLPCEFGDAARGLPGDMGIRVVKPTPNIYVLTAKRGCVAQGILK